MREWIKTGTPWVWLNAGALTLSLVAVLGLILLIAVRGLGHFWPHDVYSFEYHLPDGTEQTFIGEIHSKETLTNQRLSNAMNLPIAQAKVDKEIDTLNRIVPKQEQSLLAERANHWRALQKTWQAEEDLITTYKFILAELKNTKKASTDFDKQYKQKNKELIKFNEVKDNLALIQEGTGLEKLEKAYKTLLNIVTIQALEKGFIFESYEQKSLEETLKTLSIQELSEQDIADIRKEIQQDLKATQARLNTALDALKQAILDKNDGLSLTSQQRNDLFKTFTDKVSDRYLVKVGNREYYPSDFTLLAKPLIYDKSTDKNLVVFERHESGNFYGFIHAIKEREVQEISVFEQDWEQVQQRLQSGEDSLTLKLAGNQDEIIIQNNWYNVGKGEGETLKVEVLSEKKVTVAENHEAFVALRERIERVEKLHKEIKHIEKVNIGHINYQLQELTREQRRYELAINKLFTKHLKDFDINKTSESDYIAFMQALRGEVVENVENKNIYHFALAMQKLQEKYGSVNFEVFIQSYFNIEKNNSTLDIFSREKLSNILKDYTERESSSPICRSLYLDDLFLQCEANQKEFYDYTKKLAWLRSQLERDTVVVSLMQGNTLQETELPLSQIIHAYQPNAMTTTQKVCFYLVKLGEFLLTEPREANTEGGVAPAIFGTVMMVLLMSVFVTPFGIIAAVYLREYAKQGPVTQLIRIAVNNLAGVPSIVYGIFGLGFFVYFLGQNIDNLFFPEMGSSPVFGTGGMLWASLTLALLTLPVVIVATEEGLSRIPRSIREGSLALGATKAETIWYTILPIASPAMMTGLILAIARAAGEVAPLMLVGVVKSTQELVVDGNVPFLHLDRKFMHLGFHIYDVGFQSPNVEAARPLVFATAFLLVAVIVVLNLTAIQIRNHLREKYRALEG